MIDPKEGQEPEIMPATPATSPPITEEPDDEADEPKEDDTKSHR